MDRWDRFRSPLDLGDWQNVERRIGTRVPTEGVEVLWVLPDVIDLRDDPSAGQLAEVSVTGAAVTAPLSVPVAVPGEATLRYDGSESTVTVRSARPSTTPGEVLYGVQWERLEEPLRGVVYEIVADARPATGRH